jgi:hypothetical protein
VHLSTAVPTPMHVEDTRVRNITQPETRAPDFPYVLCTHGNGKVRPW